MDKEKLKEELLEIFVGELEEHIDAVSRHVLALEKSPGDAELLTALSRRIHTLKGAARSAAIRAIEESCHAVEDCLASVRGGTLVLRPDIFKLLFQWIDGMTKIREDIRRRETFPGRLDGFMKEFSAALSLAAPAVAEPVAVEVPVPPVFESVISPKTAEDTPRIGSVRISPLKLDKLFDQSGELTVSSEKLRVWVQGYFKLGNGLKEWEAECEVLDETLRQMIPLFPTRGFLKNLARLRSELQKITGEFQKGAAEIIQASHQLNDSVREVHMLPFAEVCLGLERTTRDLCALSGKDVDLRIEGGEVEVDRAILERLRNPLIHLIRNAIDHGIEKPAERVAKGKPARGKVEIMVSLKGPSIEISVADDGSGLDLKAIAGFLNKTGGAVPLNEADLQQAIFSSGFSTASQVTEISGRGLGLDAVKMEVEELRGTVEVESRPGAGTTFRLQLPLTLTTLRIILFRMGRQLFGIPSANVQRLVMVGSPDIKSVEGNYHIFLEGTPVPLMSLSKTLGLPASPFTALEGRSEAIEMKVGSRCAVFLVDSLIDEREIIVKNLGDRIKHARNFSGAAILPDGKVALILNPSELVRKGANEVSSETLLRGETKMVQGPQKRLLLVEDSLTTRTLEKAILERAGYKVTVAGNGADAWEILQREGADLVVSDVEMPKMDGFELTRTIRSSKRFEKLPVVLVTSLSTPQHRSHGAEVGANAYVAKGDFEQLSLLETIAQLL